MIKTSHKRETVEGFYYAGGKEYPYTLEVFIRDDSGRNDTFEFVWEEEQPSDADRAEEALLDEYFRKEEVLLSANQKLNRAADALYSALTCQWEDNGNIMAEAVRDHVITTLAQVTGRTFTDVITEMERRTVATQTQ